MNRRTARIAGFMFFMMVLTGIVAEVLFRGKIFGAEDLSKVSNHILANEFLYRVGITSDLFMALFYLLTALFLYKLLNHVDKCMATIMVLFATCGSVILMLNTLFEWVPLYIIIEFDYLSAFSAQQRESLALFFFNLYQEGYIIGQIFFSLWVFPLGVLIYKSMAIPRIFGILFMAETVLGLIAVVIHFMMPNATLETVFMLPMIIAEFSFMMYLMLQRGSSIKEV